MRLNLVFHDIVKNKIDIKGYYSITLDYYLDLLSEIKKIVSKKQSTFNEIHFYFDDGHKSFRNIIFSRIKEDFQKYHLAIATDFIGQDGYLNYNDILSFHRKGIKICSHGCSHVALAIYKEDVLQKTPANGQYENSCKGKEEVLTENQVIYQLSESKKLLTKILNLDIDEFVFPYGLYNNNTIEINNNLYQYLTTCDEFLDNNKYLRPRFLITNKRTVKQTISLMLKLQPQK